MNRILALPPLGFALMASALAQAAGPVPQCVGGCEYTSGYIIIDNRARTAFGVLSRKYTETDPVKVDPHVMETAAHYAKAINFDWTCTRFFPAGNRVLVLLTIACNKPNLLLRDESQALMAVGSDGAIIAGPVFESRGWRKEVQPSYRVSFDPAHARLDDSHELQFPTRAPISRTDSTAPVRPLRN